MPITQETPDTLALEFDRACDPRERIELGARLVLRETTFDVERAKDIMRTIEELVGELPSASQREEGIVLVARAYIAHHLSRFEESADLSRRAGEMLSRERDPEWCARQLQCLGASLEDLGDL